MENLYANRWLSYKNFYLCSVSHLGYIHIFFQCRHTENFIAQREVIQYLLIKSTLSRTDRFQPGSPGDNSLLRYRIFGHRGSGMTLLSYLCIYPR